ncbi:MAG: hypothetical protein PWQ68_2402, partial [Thermoanaerobacteraceae bacterium]|nr:hypothetical protein [Thermoanaerobacteraceae bacterium]
MASEKRMSKLTPFTAMPRIIRRKYVRGMAQLISRTANGMASSGKINPDNMMLGIINNTVICMA